jgi:hypothetical protein
MLFKSILEEGRAGLAQLANPYFVQVDESFETSSHCYANLTPDLYGGHGYNQKTALVNV